MIGTFGALWGITGFSLFLGSAIYRLTLLSMDAFSYDFLWYHWASLVLIVMIMAYAEGYRGFQQSFSPRFAARAKYLKSHPNTLYAILGPFFCMSYFHASRKRMVTSISLTVGIIMLILSVRLLPQPWRGIMDAGVVIGLLWGLISILIFSFQAFFSNEFLYSPEVPD
jgi:hypothetical protein